MEVHAFYPGDRTYVMMCDVVERTSTQMVLKGRNRYPVEMKIVALHDNNPLNHDSCPPHVRVVTTTRDPWVSWDDKKGTERTVEETGYLFDLSILSNVQKMILFLEREKHG